MYFCTPKASTMADNFLENHYEEYLKRKATWEKRKKKKNGGSSSTVRPATRPKGEGPY